jgi:hypothetical protein
MTSSASAALAGLRVLDLTRLLPGPPAPGAGVTVVRGLRRSGN